MNEFLLAHLPLDHELLFTLLPLWWHRTLLALASTNWGMVALVVLSGAVVYRVRGGWLGHLLPGGTTPARVLWCAWLAALAYSPERPLLIPFFVFWLSYDGIIIPHGRQMDVGYENGKRLEDIRHLNAIGTQRLFLSLTPVLLWEGSGLLWLYAGSLHGLLYLIGYQLPVPAGWTGNTNYPVDAKTAWGELLWGGAATLAMVAVLQPAWLWG